MAICQTQINVLDENETVSLKNLNGFRDAAAHDLVEITEGLLYAHAQQAILIFGALLKRVFNKELAKWLPRRILPLTTSLPTGITAIVDQDMTAISSMLSGDRRRKDDAEARLRPWCDNRRLDYRKRSQTTASDQICSANEFEECANRNGRLGTKAEHRKSI